MEKSYIRPNTSLMRKKTLKVALPLALARRLPGARGTLFLVFHRRVTDSHDSIIPLRLPLCGIE